MNLDSLEKEHTERVTEWITGGPYAVAVEVDAVIYPDRLDAPYLKPETIRYLEELARRAEAGEVEALKKAGKVYVCISETSSRVPSVAVEPAKSAFGEKVP